MAAPRGYSSFKDFERDQIRPEMRIGWSTDELENTGDDLDFDMDPFEAALWQAEQEEKEKE
jgi:hypothetical protein